MKCQSKTKYVASVTSINDSFILKLTSQNEERFKRQKSMIVVKKAIECSTENTKNKSRALTVIE